MTHPASDLTSAHILVSCSRSKVWLPHDQKKLDEAWIPADLLSTSQSKLCRARKRDWDFWLTWQTLPSPVHVHFPWTLHISSPFKTSKATAGKWERTLTKLSNLRETGTWLYNGGDPLIIKWSLVLWRVHPALNMPCDWYLACSYYLSKPRCASESEGTACNSVKQGRPGSRHRAVGLRQGFPGPMRGDSGASKLRLDGGSKVQPPERKAPVLGWAPFRLRAANAPYFQKEVFPLGTRNLNSPKWPEVILTKGLYLNDSTVQVASLLSHVLEMRMTNHSKTILKNMGLRCL